MPRNLHTLHRRLQKLKNSVPETTVPQDGRMGDEQLARLVTLQTRYGGTADATLSEEEMLEYLMLLTRRSMELGLPRPFIAELGPFERRYNARLHRQMNFFDALITTLSPQSTAKLRPALLSRLFDRNLQESMLETLAGQYPLDTLVPLAAKPYGFTAHSKPSELGNSMLTSEIKTLIIKLGEHWFTAKDDETSRNVLNECGINEV